MLVLVIGKGRGDEPGSRAAIKLDRAFRTSRSVEIKLSRLEGKVCFLPENSEACRALA
jgi:hypothetical protein